MTTPLDFHEILEKGLTVNTAQTVLKDLEQLSGLGEQTHTRWIWELLQNARDVSTDFDKQLIASVSYKDEKLVFLHNGSVFAADEIMHLIFHGSTKVEDENTIGKYGSGFLTTHLLSWEIEVSGKLSETDQWFDFHLVREPESVDALQKSMREAWKNFQDSFSHTVSITEGYTTRFTYPINRESAKKAVEAGIKTLKQYSPFVVISNPQFASVNIKNQDEELCFKAVKTQSNEEFGVHYFNVTDGKSEKRNYLLVEDDNPSHREKTSIIVPLNLNENSAECLYLEEIPRLFLGFPLVGTENFSFPAVINCLAFRTTEARDGVLLKLANNQKIIEIAYSLLVNLLQFAGTKGWSHIYQWARVIPIPDRNWIDSIWLKTCIKENFIAKIINTPVVLNAENNPLVPNSSIFPIAECDMHIEHLWELLDQCQEFRSRLPKEIEAIGWCKTIKSWEEMYGGNIPQLSKAIIDGSRLIEIITNKWSSLEELQSGLQNGVSPIEWLDQLFDFLKATGLFNDEIRKYKLFPNQKGKFLLLTNLYRDTGIGEELKDIAELLGLSLRNQLRHTHLSSLENHVGKGDLDNDRVLQSLIGKLQEHTNEKQNETVKDASVRLFSWIVKHGKYSFLSNFPVFTSDGETIIQLPSPQNSRNSPFAPVKAWPEEIRKFSDLFPPNNIMNEVYFDLVSNRDTWDQLQQQRLIRLIPIIQKKETDLKALAPSVYENEENKIDHRTEEPITVTDIFDSDAIMTRLHNGSHVRSYLFWQFLTEWLIKKEYTVLDKKHADCACEGKHEYYPVAWLKNVRKKYWIRDKQGDRSFPNAESLGKLLREKKWELTVLNESPDTVALLDALGIRPSDLKLEVIAADEEKRNEAVDLATELCVGDINTNQIREIVQDIKDDDKLYQVLEDRRKTRRAWEQNQRVGSKVEDLVRDSLEDEGFLVERIHIGADFEIEKDTTETGTITQLDIKKENQSWLVEVKSTRIESVQPSVRMSATQARKAREERERYLLCVVQLEQEYTELNLDNIKEKMLFIENIGNRVDKLCGNLEMFERFRNLITEENPEVELVVEEGKSGVLVKKTVWDADGFPLEKLAERLK